MPTTTMIERRPAKRTVASRSRLLDIEIVNGSKSSRYGYWAKLKWGKRIIPEDRVIDSEWFIFNFHELLYFESMVELELINADLYDNWFKEYSICY
uniref:Uncharacterized protein n=1 Tax=Cucumis melo TaxID=3656 RepID=A0A9I9EJS6_CUCME